MSKGSALWTSRFAKVQAHHAHAHLTHHASTMETDSVISTLGVSQMLTRLITAIGVHLGLQTAPLQIPAATMVTMEAMNKRSTHHKQTSSITVEVRYRSKDTQRTAASHRRTGLISST